ncbi:hypothetical protein [Saccharopolyspora pogona]|uniref:hypothetical protein n=1 Tax=Saccharopolyspora pogona TaxID=333966 RepID=UPI0016834490|nr:hypothetical protein [Saccharopolyspora pogona]
MVSRHMLLLAQHGVRYIQVARRGPSEADGVDVTADTRQPDQLNLVGSWTLADEMFDAGTVPQTCGDRICSRHFKGFALDTVINAITQGRPYRHLVGFSSTEHARATRDTRYNTELRTAEYPLIDWGWDRERALRFLEDTFGETWIKSASTYCLLSALWPCLVWTVCRQRSDRSVLRLRLSRMYVRRREDDLVLVSRVGVVGRREEAGHARRYAGAHRR